ncbi:serine hydrolase domain-containing protein [Aquimarina sp. MMG016]|uniref:serine hydrolase domain-containing protein n=1 Tax=Aquimarina sp. MMG016 TaxID=2822690 RepID=UPI001B39ED7A|nr:serine hydrolase domain-containing protein [Aquimarina sp. MMG016]MBQ4819877.1 beta-lactamase family protein [Aquimarina sp. MMG016]
MKWHCNHIIFSVLYLLTISVFAQQQSENCKDPIEFNINYSKKDAIQNALDIIIEEGVPGVSLAVFSDEGWFMANSGVVNIEKKTPMQSCYLQYLQSIAKTYMAVAVLRLFEQGKINLDNSIAEYLPSSISKRLPQSDKISVRMLLNHTSGLAEYNFNPNYVTKLLQEPDHIFKPEDYIEYIYDKPLDFTQGSKYSYRNTNYVLLAIIVNEITGDHKSFIQEFIFKPLELRHTYYPLIMDELGDDQLVSAYWDRHSQGIIENASKIQQSNVAHMVGDDGIVTTPIEAILFLKGLMEGKLIKESTLQEMLQWVKRKDGSLAYGLGIGYSNIGGNISYGHTGGGIGAGSELRYFPDKNIYMFVGINLGTVTESPLHKGIAPARDKLFKTLLE